MTYKEAIKEMQKFERRHYEKPNGDADLKVYEALRMAIEAMEKQMQKKPKITHHVYMINGEEAKVDFNHCPICFNNLGYYDSLLDKGISYCYRCGQNIDWIEVLNT